MVTFKRRVYPGSSRIFCLRGEDGVQTQETAIWSEARYMHMLISNGSNYHILYERPNMVNHHIFVIM